MRIGTFVTIVLSTTLSSATTVERRTVTADTIIQDVYNIHNGVLANREATELYEGGNLLTTLVQGTPILATVGAIHVANRKGYVDANLAPHFNEEDTRRIFNVVVDTVGNSIPNATQVLIEKQSAFEKSGLAPVGLASLELLLDDHDTFSNAVTAKAFKGNAELSKEGEEVVGKIHSAIQSAIDVYAT